MLVKYWKLVYGKWKLEKTREGNRVKNEIERALVDSSIFNCTVMLSSLHKDSSKNDCAKLKLKQRYINYDFLV